MSSYNLKIEILSDTIFASSGGGSAIDSITAHYSNGLPYIPAKTIKGLLKESAIEIREFLGHGWKVDDKSDPINILFGREGDGNNGALSILNGDLDKIDKLEEEIKENKLLSSEVLSYYTFIRHQTAMQNGVAKEGSLRTLQVLKPGLEFYVPIKLDSITNYELLKYSCFNLRRVGINRNRGFGNIRCSIKDPIPSTNIQVLDGNKFMIKLVTPALLPAIGADSNTVGSEKIISGRKILGMLASAFIKEKNLQNAHNDATFRRIFLSGSVKFSDAYPIMNKKVCFPLGLHWVADKKNTKTEIDYNSDKQVDNWKGIRGLYSIDGKMKAKVSTVLDFHNSRNKVNQKTDNDFHSRIKGSNRGDGIYYYESIQKEQEFAFKVEGLEEDLQIIRSLLRKGESLRLGKSSSTSLGRVKVLNFGGTIFRKAPDTQGDLLLTFVSPVILRNKYGEFVPSLEALSLALGTTIIIHPENARLRTTKVQVYQSSIQMQFPEMMAIAAGSSVKVSKDEYSRISSTSLGEFTHEGFGKFMVESMLEDAKRDMLLENIRLKDDKMKIQDKEDQDTNLIPDSDSRPLSSFIRLQREVSKAKLEAIGKNLHKNTTMLMIAFMKDVQFLVKNDFKTACLVTAEKFTNTNRFSIKVIETLHDLLNLGNTDYVKLRKDDINKFKSEFANALAESLSKYHSINKFISVEAKTAYWVAYFNNCKIKNRG